MSQFEPEWVKKSTPEHKLTGTKTIVEKDLKIYTFKQAIKAFGKEFDKSQR